MSTGKGNSILDNARYVLKQGVFFTLVFLLTLFAYAISQIRLADYFPIQTVNVIGQKQIARDDLREIVKPLVMPGFFAINVETIRDRLLQLPWISEVVVTKRWPNEVTINLSEKIPAARWNKDNLLSTDGQVFRPKDIDHSANLVDFVGPDGQQITMLKYFVNINRILEPLHAKISYLELTPYATWKLKLDNGMTLKIGQNDILTRMTHFVKVYPKIIGDQATNVDYIDLRYPNGMAVRWKD